MDCDLCGRSDTMDYSCRYCGEKFCTEHRLPESHDCIGLKVEQANRGLRDKQEPWFKDEFRLSNTESDHDSKYDTDSQIREQTSSRSQSSESSPSADNSGQSNRQEAATESDALGTWGAKPSDADESPRSTSTSVSGDCKECGQATAMDYECNRCGGRYCGEHRMPESHDCSRSTTSSIGSGVVAVYQNVVSRIKRAAKFPATTIFKIGKIGVLVGLIIAIGSLGGFIQLDGVQGQASPIFDAAANATSVEKIDQKQTEALVREDINEIRENNGLSSLSSSDQIRSQAQLHSENMAERDELAHDFPGSTTDERLNQAGCGAGGENVAQTWVREQIATQNGTKYISSEEELAESLVEQWINSPGHRENILMEDWSLTGVGVEIRDDGKVYATQKFCG